MIDYYSNPVARFEIGDVVRVGVGSVEWTIVGKGATCGVSLLAPKSGRRRSAQAWELTLVRRQGVTP